jgi:hypothetical protein
MARFSGTSETGIPQRFRINSDWDNYYVNASWNGKHVFCTGSGWTAIFLPDDASLNLPIGTTFTVVTDENAYVYINSNDYNLTHFLPVGIGYSPYGYDIPNKTMATVMKIDSDKWIISGYGITQD